MRTLVFGAFGAALLLSTSAHALDGWHVDSSTVIPAETQGFDYIGYDASTNKVFLGHRQEGMQVFDPVQKKVVKVIAGTKEHSGNSTVPIPEFDLGLTNNLDGTITPFKLSTLENIGEPVNVGHKIDTSHYDPGSKRLVVNIEANADGTTDLPVLEVPSLKIVGTIKAVTKKAEHAAADGKGNFYVTSRDPAKVIRLDTANLKVTAEWPTPGCALTTGLALDTVNRRIFLGCRTEGDTKAVMEVMNADTGAIVYKNEIGNGNDGVVFDPQSKRIFAANAGGPNINVFEQVDADHYNPIDAVTTDLPTKVLAYDPKTATIYTMGMKVGEPKTFTVFSLTKNK